ncbi:MAG: hypothetical protein KJ057_01060 [Phycisphaerae bacterium]|nr:hypothetical protein [Planctomycetia bacterium]MCK6463422.1 hypothetical protein [Phycisphaerae bacterium]MCL4717044.1 hypothetical protein [Phycisphaerae bacterium]NUQ09260.1 hypothetical protein [Phycisphaerae bacterium]
MSTFIFGLPATVALMLLVLTSALGLVFLIQGLRGQLPVPGIEVARRDGSQS